MYFTRISRRLLCAARHHSFSIYRKQNMFGEIVRCKVAISIGMCCFSGKYLSIEHERLPVTLPRFICEILCLDAVS